MSSRNIPADKINLRLILDSGKMKAFLFSPSDSAGDIAQTVFDRWPEGDRLIGETGESRSKLFFMQNISLAIQRGNAASVMGTFPPGISLEEIFYLI